MGDWLFGDDAVSANAMMRFVGGVAKKLAIAGAVAALAACASTPKADAPKAKAAKRDPSKPAFVAEDFLSASAPKITAALGEPALVRREGKGEFRRYVLAECSLVVIFYPGEDGTPTAAHLDAVASRSEDEKPDLDACLAVGLGAGLSTGLTAGE